MLYKYHIHPCYARTFSSTGHIWLGRNAINGRNVQWVADRVDLQPLSQEKGNPLFAPLQQLYCVSDTGILGVQIHSALFFPETVVLVCTFFSRNTRPSGNVRLGSLVGCFSTSSKAASGSSFVTLSF